MPYQDALTDTAKAYSVVKTLNDFREEVLSLEVKENSMLGRFTISRQVFRQEPSSEARISDNYQYIFQTILDFDNVVEKDVIEFENRKYIILKKLKVKGKLAHHLVFYLDDYHG